MRTLHNLHSIDIGVGEIGVTVRRGTKWADVKPGELIEICVCRREGMDADEEWDSHRVVGAGEVVDVFSGKFMDIPARVIEYEHEEASRLYSGLFFSMRRAYGREFSEDEEVVVLSYRRVSAI